MTHFTNRQAIQTKFLSPTNSRGSRVKAFAAAGSVTIGWDHRLNSEQNHRAAAEMFANRMNWVGAWAAGTLPSGDMVFVTVEEGTKPAFRVNDRKPVGTQVQEAMANLPSNPFGDPIPITPARLTA